MSQTTTVFIVDDDEAVRDSVAILLESVDREVALFESADEFLNGYQGERGVLVLDIRMPGMNGLQLQKELVNRDVSIPIVFITGHGDIPMAVEAMRFGAVDFLRKPFRDQELLDSIDRALAQEQGRWDSQVRQRHAVELASYLTPREKEVFELVCAGHANKVIAMDLGISERTVEIHRHQVMQKMDVRSLPELVRLKLLIEQAQTA